MEQVNKEEDLLVSLPVLLFVHDSSSLQVLVECQIDYLYGFFECDELPTATGERREIADDLTIEVNQTIHFPKVFRIPRLMDRVSLTSR